MDVNKENISARCASPQATAVDKNKKKCNWAQYLLLAGVAISLTGCPSSIPPEDSTDSTAKPKPPAPPKPPVVPPTVVDPTQAVVANSVGSAGAGSAPSVPHQYPKA
jgi:hypothetical protein